MANVWSGSTFKVVNDPTPAADVVADISANHARGRTDLANPFWNYAYPAGGSKARPGELRYPELLGALGMNYVRVQIHETGAALTYIRNAYHPAMWKKRLPDNNLDSDHEDDGPSLEECVGRNYYEKKGLTPAKYP